LCAAFRAFLFLYLFSELLSDVSDLQAYAITEKIGYPDYIMNNTLLDLDYEEVRTGKLYCIVLPNVISDAWQSGICSL